MKLNFDASLTGDWNGVTGVSKLKRCLTGFVGALVVPAASTGIAASEAAAKDASRRTPTAGNIRLMVMARVSPRDSPAPIIVSSYQPAIAAPRY
ncbi:hypothetical protein GCM10011529_16090 [Polymorphobacter glacialis]|uniref:Uncharacterized protein n=1 Tax=Sandarakinorhabdus glacialis TaxID=1614636 RepID=A0A917E6Z9_9SPHN|nr:hypothetical protein GCM10011529_16090 [Polymorphobacter glacialis]